ncbi:MAG: diguanylate cyclase [Chlamydiia bacterium]|nr:diguanylate cyclase [Chlamydiia bacterium]
MRNKSCLTGIIFLGIIITFALLVPLVSPYRYDEIHLAEKNMPPSALHIFGTDDLGRDMATRVATGLRISLIIGSLAAILDVLIGVSWGTISGYAGGMCDQVMMRIADFIYSLPYLLAVILIAAVIGPGLLSILTAMCLIGWIQMARLTRIQVQRIKHYDFVKAAYALGLSPSAIIFRHILPNIGGTLIAMLMLTIPQAIFAEAFLSFLGIGIQPPMASLGSMTSDGLSAMRYYPWRLFAPACMVTMTIFAFNLIGDGLRDLLDPKQRNLVHVK